ncbi:hypothetical protein CF386_08250 [Paraphotobacterium marinum]|uniref:Uncharacterized protein n=1 Tax=Paraphotobacterium marinum TaxID=1755811 RepID=A0A220VFL2_9GAMM|nr:hypothetical protein [Paraphotobacterium marinum]ASK79050.1 hypothetical protein CF386_08250 [Paraphotobacterium marinum]
MITVGTKLKSKFKADRLNKVSVTKIKKDTNDELLYEITIIYSEGTKHSNTYWHTEDDILAEYHVLN